MEDSLLPSAHKSMAEKDWPFATGRGKKRLRMAQRENAVRVASRYSRYSYLFMLGLAVLVIWLRLATPLLAGLFAYLALTRLEISKRGGKALAVIIFLIALAGVAYGLGYFINQTIRALPEIGDKSIPAVIEWAKQYGIELPFTDYDSMKDLAFDTLKSEVRFLS